MISKDNFPGQMMGIIISYFRLDVRRIQASQRPQERFAQVGRQVLLEGGLQSLDSSVRALVGHGNCQVAAVTSKADTQHRRTLVFRLPRGFA